MEQSFLTGRKQRVVVMGNGLTVVSILKATSCVKSRHATGSQDLSKETLRIQTFSVFYCSTSQ